ncbi:MAG: carbohydrate-binding domain-containing protein [Mobilitalea sp.]
MRNKKFIKNKITSIIGMILITTMIFTGCAGTASTEATSSTDSETLTTTALAGAAVTTSYTTSDTSEVVVDTEFSAKDLEVGYEDTTAVNITLNGTSIEVDGEGASADDSILTISEEGTYVITGTLNDGQIVVEAADTDKVQIVLNGATITNSDGAAIYIKTADKVFITLEEGTENTLTDGTEYIQTDDNTVDGVIFSMSDLTINGDGTLNITGNYKHGIASKDDLIITGGTINVTALKDALNGQDCVKIKDGVLTLSAESGNGIQSKNGDDTTKGYVYICGGIITVTNSTEGIEGTAIIIEDGTVNITASDDGFNASSGTSSASEEAATTEAATTSTATTSTATTSTATDTTSDTTISDTTSDTTISDTTTDTATFDFAKQDQGGMQGTDTNCYISISGGTLTIDAEGDGIDSNGSLYISGGTTYVSGPSESMNGGLDYSSTADITGGTVIITGTSQMAQGFSDTSSQYSLLYNLTSSCAAGTEVVLTDAEGNVIASVTPDKEYQSVVISTPDLAQDATYTLTCGDQTAEITLASVVTSNGQTEMGGFGGGGDRPSGEKGERGTLPDGAAMPDGGTKPDGTTMPEEAAATDSTTAADSTAE